MEDSTKVRGCKVFNMAEVVHSIQFCSMIAMIVCVFFVSRAFMIHLEPHGHWGMKIDENSQQREGSKSDDQLCPIATGDQLRKVMFFSWRSSAANNRSAARSESMERSKQLPVMLRRIKTNHGKLPMKVEGGTARFCMIMVDVKLLV